MSSNKKQKNILFVCHIASLSGAPLLLLDIIREFKSRTEIPFTILIVKDGALRNEFEKLGKTFIWNVELKEPTVALSNRFINLFNKVRQQIYQAYFLFRARRTSLVFLNTLSNGHIQKRLHFLSCTFVCYVHEMQMAINTITNESSLRVIRDSTDLFIACSNAVKGNLIGNTGISGEKIRVFNTALANVHREKSEYAEYIHSFRKAHTIPPGAIIIGAVGTNERRKGFDLFLPMITLYFHRFPESDVFFVWKGFDYDNPASFPDLYDLARHEHKDRILLLAHDNKGIETIACLDIHVLMSREDPYPLVVLEAASFGIPTVCFKNAGGTPEFVEEDSGICIDYCDLSRMAGALNLLATDPGDRKRRGFNAREKVMARHGRAICMPAFMEVLEGEDLQKPDNHEKVI